MTTEVQVESRWSG
jgi:hypothetical protein